jgi:hypothetical protein
MKENMPQEENNYVAVFIDWDNLAISTSVDFGGAVPDVRAIIRAAQRFGTVVLARAYAEWNVSSDRLSVYRAGIEPVYAPTFRFEPEPGSQMPRGKSLADPCLVTDSIDVMHLMPNINVFVLVSGDKDLIPIVRLAQLRGKKVVVIGPDFVAAILREMADEYVPYRLLVETSEAAPVPEVTTHARPSRRLGQGAGRAQQLPAGPAPRPSAPPAPSRAAPAVPAAPVPRPAPTDVNGNVAEEVPGGLGAEAPATVPVEETLDTGPLFEIITTILREREQTGKPRLRATNLKDQLLARIPGFNERKYGFPRFKDLLSGAEKAGVLTVSRTGPVQWVASATPAAPAREAPAEVAAVTPPPSPAAAPPEPVPTPDATAEGDGVDEEVVRFILDLRDRSRWLTYTYLLTNLLNHLGKGATDAAADAAARTTLNRLVQSGVLIVDREPREIDVNGTHHRVRLCHIVDEHPLVQRVREQMTAEKAAAMEQPELATPAEEAAPAEPAEATTATETPVAAAEAPVGEAPEGPAEQVGPEERRPEEDTAAPPADVAPAEGVGEAEAPATGAEAPAAPAPSAEAAPEPEAAAGASAENGVVPSAPLTLSESYEVLREVVREATGPSRPSTGPAAIKNRLVRRLGSFDEHSFGFSKFKDYLLSAERAGAVKVEVAGNTTRVSLPSTE